MAYIKLDTRILASATLWADTDARGVFIAALLMDRASGSSRSPKSS